jgi:hypothetical protein
MCEQGGPSEPVPVVDLASSSDEEDFFTDTSRDEEFARKLFGDLNRDILGPPGDSKVIILSDSDADVEAAPPSAVNSPATPASAADADDAPDGVQNDSSDGGDEVGSPYAAAPRQRLQGGVLQGELSWLCIAPQLLLQRGIVLVMQNHC